MIHIRALLSDIFAPVDGPVLRTPSGVNPAVYDTSVSMGMKESAVYSAVKLISEGVARLALSLQRYNEAKQCFVDYVDDALYVALRVRPNAHMTSFVMWRDAVQQVLLTGNAYILPTRNNRHEVTGLTLLSPGSTSYDSHRRLYVVNDTQNHIVGTYEAKDIVHLLNVSIDGGYVGLSTIQLAAKSLAIIRLSDDNAATTLSNGGRMRGLLSGAGGVDTFGRPSTNQLNDVSTIIEEHIRDGRTVIPVPQDMHFQSITLSPADAKVLESKQVTIRDIARFFRVHPDLLYEGSNNTYKAAEVPNVMFLTQTLEPLLVQIEQELLVKLLPRAVWGKRRITFDRETLYTTDLQTEGNYYEKMLQTGIYTVNELRAKKGMPPVEGGDVPLVSANLKGIEVVIQESNNNTNNHAEGNQNN